MRAQRSRGFVPGRRLQRIGLPCVSPNRWDFEKRMSSTARLNAAFEAISVTVDLDGKPIRAVITREALEALTQQDVSSSDAMLEVFRGHQHNIEVEVLDRYFQDRREPVVLHVQR